ncbi:MAG: ion channel [Cyanophyceae cyanobacterium]
MSILLAVLGLLIVLMTTLDALVTTLTVGGAGIITGRISSALWWVALQIHRQRSNHRMLATMGWVILVGLVLVWLFLTWFGWTLLFSATEGAVVKASNLQPASIWERIYFTGFTISTLGMGDYQPQGIFWQMATAVASANGFFLVTLGVAYLLPVVSAATAKRSLAIYLSSLGGTGDEILTRTWNGKDFGQLDQHLINLTPLLSTLGESHLTYPVLHYFHSLERSRAMVLSIVALDEALTLLHYAVEETYRPDAAALEAARRASAAFLKTLKSAYLNPSSHSPPFPALDLLRIRGIPTVSDEEFWQATKQITRRRQLLLALVHNDGWTWEAVASSKTTNRASSLDDETIIEDAVLN